jgi:Flp pilus assembly protein TadD
VKVACAAKPDTIRLAHDWLGVEHGILGRFDDARKGFERSISLDPNSWSGHYDFAVLLSQTGDLTGAERSTPQVREKNRKL